MELRRTMQVLTVILAIGATAYLWASPAITEYATGESVRSTIWADAGDWVPIVAVSLAFLFVIVLGSWASLELGKSGSYSWRVAMIIASVTAVAGVGITGFSVGLAYLPATLLLVILVVYTLVAPQHTDTAKSLH